MARNLNAVVLVLLAVANLLHVSTAQTRHVVGDSTGWTIPSGGASFYTNWTSNKTFTVGDTLVFNFASGQHDVAKVTKSGFDGCNGGSALQTVTTTPANMTLNETGEQYFICTFGTHCSLGQKLSVNVVRASASSPVPAPQPTVSPPPKSSPTPAPAPAPTTTTPPPAPVPAPSPSNGPVTHTVGDSLGWTVPTSGVSAYQSWASNQSFNVGDILVFNFQVNAHNVEEVTKKKFDSCNSTSPIATYGNPPVRVTLNKTGEHYFICGIPGHCSGGQKLSVNVGGSSGTATPPSASGSPSPSSSVNPSTPSPTSSLSPPPENSGAASLGVAGLFATLISVAAAFFY